MPTTLPVTTTEIATWEQHYKDLATATLAKSVFTSDGEREYAVCMEMLSLCSAGDQVNDAVRMRILGYMERNKLYAYSGEGWTQLSDVIQSSMDSYASKGQMSEMNTIATVVAPFAEKYELPTLTLEHIGYLREASSALKGIIQSSIPEPEKVQSIQRELHFIQNEAPNRNAVRDRYRSLRGIPGIGSYNDLGDGTAVIMITGPISTINAIRSMAARLVEWTAKAKIASKHSPPVPSKINGAEVVDHAELSVTRKITTIVDQTTGEITATYS